eukprot:401782-Pyramimonas_sp.AAC.1
MESANSQSCATGAAGQRQRAESNGSLGGRRVVVHRPVDYNEGRLVFPAPRYWTECHARRVQKDLPCPGMGVATFASGE